MAPIRSDSHVRSGLIIKFVLPSGIQAGYAAGAEEVGFALYKRSLRGGALLMGTLRKECCSASFPQTLRAIDGDIDSVAHRAKHCRPVSRGNAFWYPAPVIQAQDQDTFKWQGQHYAVHTSVLHRDLVQAGEAEHAILHQEQGDCSCCNGKILPATWEEFATSR
ncbi:uncharacterized protein PG998_013874 [Apiospora kogelbergensis]|uniref:uncharacterized protein n=1 Tax=Apiospora kogelbergensis TaxID=1337665 RepID=UPI00312D84EA